MQKSFMEFWEQISGGFFQLDHEAVLRDWVLMLGTEPPEVVILELQS